MEDNNNNIEKAAFTTEDAERRDLLSQSIATMMEDHKDIFRGKLENATAQTLPSLEIEDSAPAEDGQEKSYAIDGNKVVPVEVLDKPLAEIEREKAVTKAVEAIKSGDIAAIGKSLTDAHQKYGRDKSQFDAFAQKLGEDLKAQGFDMKSGNLGWDGRSINIHRHGAANAVGFDLTFNKDTNKSEVQTVAYDWINKGRVSEKAADIVKDFATPGANAADSLKDHGQIAKLFDSGMKDGSVVEAHREMLKTAESEYKRGGMEAVRALERMINSKVQTPGAKRPAFIEEDGKLTAVTAEPVTDKAELVKAAEDPAYRANNGMAKHPEHGMVRVITRTGPVVLPKR
ncbi:MAG: hypothetical protein K2W95_34385 [Candidatus Obscuribacterales bacterium]|nr:hypothetical protein [Candidatus Obscuribacterales bacterium]